MQCSAGEQTQRVDAHNLLETLIGDYHDAGRSIALEGRGGRPHVTCPHALCRVLINLIDGGLRYGDDVRLCVRVEARRLVLAVVDFGAGIVPAQLDAVFVPWYTVSGDRCTCARVRIGTRDRALSPARDVRRA